MRTRARAFDLIAALGVTIFAIVATACTGGPSVPSATATGSPASTGSVVTPTIAAISPSLGSTSGDTTVVITGSGLMPGITVTLDGVAASATFDRRFTDRVYVDTPPHAAGTFDVVVTNARGESSRLTTAYTYAEPGSFDFTGTWWGYPNDGSDLPVQFTIENNALVRASCDTSVISISPPVPIVNGAFSFSRDGSAMTGKIVSASQAVGAIDVSPCNAPRWDATRKP